MSVPPPVSSSASSTTARAPSALLGFWLDVVLAVVLQLGVVILCGMAWGVWRVFETGRAAARAGGPVPNSAELAKQIGQPGGTAQLWFTLVSAASVALALYFWRRRASADERSASIRATRRASTWGWALLVAIGVFVGSSVISAIGKQFGIEPAPTNVPIIQQALADSPVFLFLLVGLLIPACEELLYRRVLFGRLWSAGRPWLGMALSSLIFALVHEPPFLSQNHGLALLELWLIYGGMGVAFAWVYRRTGTLWAAIAAHGLNNAMALAAMALVPGLQ